MRAYLVEVLKVGKSESPFSVAKVAHDQQSAAQAIIDLYRDTEVELGNIAVYSLRPATIKKHKRQGPPDVFRANAVICDGFLCYATLDGCYTFSARCGARVLPYRDDNTISCAIYGGNHDVTFDKGVTNAGNYPRV